MSKSIAQFELDMACERWKEAVNRKSSIKRNADLRKTGRIMRKGLTLLVHV